MSQQPQALKQAQVYLPFEARRTKRGVHVGEQYVVQSYTLFDGREACDLCDRLHQAEQQVRISSAAGELRAGLECLHQVSGITRARMDRAVAGQVGLAVRVRRLVAGHSTMSFDGLQQILMTLQEGAADLVQDVPGGQALLREIEAIRQDIAARAPTDQTVGRLGEITDYLAYIKEARDDPQRHQARVQAMRHDPAPGAGAHLQLLAGLPLERPLELTTTQVQQIKRVLNKLGQIRLASLKTPAVDPQAFGTSDAYLEALHAHFEGLVRRGEPLRGTLQAQYDQLRWGRDAPVTEVDILSALSLPCVTPVHHRLKHLRLDQRPAREYLSLRHGRELEFYASSREHLQEVRTDHPDRRQDGRPARPEDREPVRCWFIAYWVPDAWHSVNLLWRAYDGREALLSFPTPD